MWLVTMTASAAEYGPALEGEILATESSAATDTGYGSGCSDQFLENGVQLPDLPLFYHREQPNTEWGTAEMIDLIIEAGRHMSWVMPQASPFVVGDISSERGGYAAGHISHRGGVDADIGIYRTGGWQNTRSFTRLAPSELDVAATWMLMSTFLASGNVDFILIDRGHIAKLRAYVLANGLLTPEEAARIFAPEGHGWESTGTIRHAPNHQDHMHVRVLCSDGTRSGR
jgi:murein endopeptidase